MTNVPSREILWQPDAARIGASNLTRYQAWLQKTRGLAFADYPTLWRWSTDEPEAFWSSIADFFGVKFHHPAEQILSSRQLPGAHWFEGATLNYAEHALAVDTDEPALLFEGESPGGGTTALTITRRELRRQVVHIAATLRDLGVRPGDRVAGYLSNTPEAVVAFLASASVGAVWSNCPVEMTARSVLERLAQIEPVVLFASCRYAYGNKTHIRDNIVAEVAAGLPSLRQLVLVTEPADANTLTPLAVPVRRWSDLLAATIAPELHFEPVPFEHPLWILYSSGTTGKPKAIVHGHGGILLEHLKALGLHLDLRAGDCFFWYTTSGWMMWNFLVSGLLLPGVTIVLYDGSPKHPNFEVLWSVVERLGVTFFGASAPYFMACRGEGLAPGRTFALENLRGLGSTGAPLPAEGFRWIYDQVKHDLLLGSVSGGTDVCSAFILCHPHLPVRAGELQALALGAKIEAWNDAGQPVLRETGELVLTLPYPSMPIFLWNDPDGRRLRASYFEKFPHTWSHGDWIELDAPAGPCVIHGRSDATLNRGGVRMGTVEFYATLEAMPEIAEALVIDLSGLGRDDRLLLFVKLRAGLTLDETVRGKIVQRLRSDVSPRHVPDAIYEVADLPRTANGKKIEVPVKRILLGTPAAQAVQQGSVANPESLDFFIALASTLAPAQAQGTAS